VLGNPGWKTRLSIGLDRSYYIVLRWSSGEVPVPGYVEAAIELLESCPMEQLPPRWKRAVKA
jgi:hypothetical protein